MDREKLQDYIVQVLAPTLQARIGALEDRCMKRFRRQQDILWWIGDKYFTSGIWAIKSSPQPGTDVVGWYLTSFNAPNRPGTFEKDDWQHWRPTENIEGKGEWVTANLRVHCPFEMQPLTSVSSWPFSGVLATDTGAVVGQGDWGNTS